MKRKSKNLPKVNFNAELMVPNHDAPKFAQDLEAFFLSISIEPI